MITVARFLLMLCFVLLSISCKDNKTNASRGTVQVSADSSLHSFDVRRSHGGSSFDVFTGGLGSLRQLTLILAGGGTSDTVREEINGVVANAVAGDLNGDAFPEIYVFCQSAGSGSYASVYAYQKDADGIHAFTLPELDKRLSAGYMGHDTLWVRDSVLVRSFPVYTESDLNASATGGTRNIEYVLRRDENGKLGLRVSHITNQQSRSQ